MARIHYERKNHREIIKVGGRTVEFMNSSDAWTFLQLMRELFGSQSRHVTGCYPVTRLVPKTAAKKKHYIVAAIPVELPI